MNLHGIILLHLLEEVNDIVSRIWSPVSHMNAVVSSAELRQHHDDCFLFSLIIIAIWDNIVHCLKPL